MSVSHKIVNVSVSHKIVIYRVLVTGGRRTSLDNSLQWSLLVPGGLHVNKWSWNLVKNRLKTILWLTDISCMTYRHFQNLFKLPIVLPHSVWTCIWFCLISVFFRLEEKITWYIFLQLLWFVCCPQIMW